jgi:hypothetical protein
MIADQIGMVTYADHVEALRQVTALATPETVTQATYWYEQGRRDALAEAKVHAATERWSPLSYKQGQRVAITAAVQRVEALPHSLECVTRDVNYNRPCNCLHGDALDAIKGDQP